MSFIELADFRSRLKDYARPNRFRVSFSGTDFINFKDGEVDFFYNDLPYTVKSVSLIGRTLTSVKIDYADWTIPLASGGISGEQISITFYVDYKHLSVGCFDSWITTITDINNMSKNKDWSDYRAAQVLVEQLGRTGETLKSYTFEGLVPVSMSAITLDSDSVDSLETFDVIFAYIRKKRN